MQTINKIALFTQLVKYLFPLILSEEGKYTEDMKIMVKELRKGIFCLSKEVLTKIEDLTRQTILSAEKPVITYFELINMLLNYIENCHTEKMDIEAREIRSIENLKREFGEKEIEFRKALSRKDEYYLGHMSTHEKDIKFYEEQVRYYTEVDD
jgi:hypothetical protein